MRTVIFLLLVLHLAPAHAEQADCACLPQRTTIDSAPPAFAIGAEQRLLRDFTLFSYRNIANDAVLGDGPYLQTLREAIAPACASRDGFKEWLRGMLLDASGTAELARRIATARILAEQCAGQR